MLNFKFTNPRRTGAVLWRAPEGAGHWACIRVCNARRPARERRIRECVLSHMRTSERSKEGQ